MSDGIQRVDESTVLRPRSIQEAMEFARLIAASDFAPKDYRGKPGNVLAAVQMGAELGLAPLQALQNIAVINGRPSVWGDAALALVQSHPACEDVQESLDDGVASCTVKRRGRSPVTRTFSVDDAKTAKLWGKQGPWQQYPNRMLQMRARGFALRDAFADALKGLWLAEESQDIEVEVTAKPVTERRAVRGKKQAESKKGPADSETQEWAVPYGEHEGKMPADLPSDVLMEMELQLARAIDDPRKARFRASNERGRAAVQAELERRIEAEAAEKAAGPKTHTDVVTGDVIDKETGEVLSDDGNEDWGIEQGNPEGP